MENELKILFVEDVPADAELAKWTLDKEGIKFQSRIVEDETDFIQALETFVPDIIISDYSMPHFNGMSALKILLENNLTTPFILLTGSMNEIIAVDCVKAGASDYIIKEHITRLPFAVKLALEKKKMRLEKENADKEIRILNRVYAMLSHTNVAIVHIKEPQELFETICKIAIEKGNFLLAWIGKYDIQKNKVDVIASAGLNKGYLDNLNIDLNNEMRSNGPTGKTIKSGIKVLSNDIVEDEYMLSWRDEALKSGYRSSASFPIFVSGKIWGTFNLYSAEKGFFNEDELKLLDEMCMDISFALEFIQKESERKQAVDIQKASEERFKTIFNSAPMGIALIDSITGRIHNVNPMFAKIAGRSIAEMDNIDWMSITHPDDIHLDLDNMARLVAGEINGFQMEKRYIHPDGSFVWVNMTIAPLEIENKTNPHHLCMIEDITERKRTEEALRESEERYRSIFESINDCIYTVSPDGKLININPAFELLTNWSVEEWIDKPFASLVHPEDLPKAINAFQKILSGEKVETYELRILTKSGEYRIGEFTSSLKRSDEIVEVLGIARDITERKRIEKELRESEEKFRRFLEFISTPIANVNKDGVIKFVNKQFVKVFGYTEVEIPTIDDWWLISYPDEQYRERLKHKWFSAVTYAAKTGTDIISDETHVKCKDGSTREVIISGTRIDDNLLVTLIDITERKLAEENILKMGQHYQTLIEKASDGIVLLDAEANFKFISHSAKQMFGYSDSDEPKQNPAELIHPDDLNMVLSNLARLFEDPSYVPTLQYRFAHKNGNWIWVETTLSNFLADPNVESIVLNFRDITERKRVEQELIISKEQAERSDKLKDAFIANISHEIRTPLNIILGYTGIIEETYASQASKEEKVFFASVQSGADRLIRTVDLVLNVSRLQTDDVMLKLEKVHVPALIETLIKELMPLAQKQSLTLSFINDIGDIAVNADLYCLSQALVNLIDNAIKFTKVGTITVRLYRKQNDVCLDITDTGIGISEVYLTDIYKPYSQEAVGYTRGYEGIGLGLTLVKQYLSLHNVPITITSKKGFGSTFSVCLTNIVLPNYLPEHIENISWEDLQSHPVKAMNVIPTLQKLVILSVEDDLMTQKYMNEILRKKFDVVFTDSVAGAWEIIRSQAIDLILLDISLQGDQNGLDLVRELRLSEKFSTLPVIAVTAHAFATDRVNSMEAGCDEYISKPINKTKLLEMIGEVMEKACVV